MLAVQSLWFMESQTIQSEYTEIYTIHQINSEIQMYCIYLGSIEIEEGSILKKYLDAARNLTPEERGKLLQNDTSFTEAHQELAIEGQTDANPDTNPVIHHFVVFVNHKNQLYELDGRKSFPINHGSTSEETFLQVRTFSKQFLYLLFYFC